MGEYHSSKKQKAIEKGFHLMNKNEAKMLRHLKIKTGLTKEQILEVKEYRVMLSEAQDAGEKRLSYNQGIEKRKKRILKSITKRLKLAKEHPLVVAEFRAELQKKYIF
jgi:hypothetical protein